MQPIPMLQEEVKQKLKERQDQDGAKAIAYMEEEMEEPSVASKIYRYWQLDRQFIRECHKAMADDRKLQVTFDNLIGATRFKTLRGAQLIQTKCPKQGRGKPDSWEHILECYS